MTVQERIVAARTSRWLRACARVGDAPRVYGRPSVDVYGGTIRIGNRFSLSSRPVASHLVAGPGALLDIGDDVWLGHGAAVAAFERVEIGSGTQIGPFLIVMDTNFHGGSGDQSVQHDCRPIVIGRNCRIGTRVTITRGVTIGDGAEILAGSVVTSSIPDNVCAGGARARVLGPAGDPLTRWDSASALAPIVLADTLNLPAPPGADLVLADVGGWNEAGIERFAAAMAQTFGAALHASDFAACRTIADVATAAEAARMRIPGTSYGS